MPQREIILNGSTFAKTMQWIASVEEADGLDDDEYVPEDRVVDIVEFTTNEDGRRTMEIGYFKSITSDRVYQRATIYY